MIKGGFKLPEEVAKEFVMEKKTPARFAHSKHGIVDLRTIKLPQAKRLAEDGIYLKKKKKDS